jgi:UDP-N-acetylmuramate--alanine ligase
MNSFFIGIGGMGMSGLAKILHESGHIVAGSDRNLSGDYCEKLRKLGIELYPQDGSGPEKFMRVHGFSAGDFNIVKSTAVEDTVSDVVTAERLGIRQIMRSDLLASLFNAKLGIAIGGTAGKTTTTGLVAWVLKYCGREPSCAVGGIMAGLETNALVGDGDSFVIEADESDGSIVKYLPQISVITNISRDHKPLEELKELFTAFIENTKKTVILCADDPHTMELAGVAGERLKTYAIHAEANYRADIISLEEGRSLFKVGNTEFEIKTPGEHNVANALACIAACNSYGICLTEIADALYAFPGMKRRFEKAGEVNGITVIDDFAHNPAEIAAAVRAARNSSSKRFIVYQPHGFGPTNFTKDDLIEVFSSLKEENEFLFLDEIYYGGGTTNKNISSKDLVAETKKTFKNVSFVENREELVKHIAQNARAGDLVLVMGARDINLICQPLLKAFEQANCAS